MDIWQWYDQYERDLAQTGQTYITDHLNKLFRSVVDVNADVSKALLPEAKALKKTARNPWLEVMIGHWEMRHRLGTLGEGETALGEVVALFERAHQPDTMECPQSICVTQDLSDCYSNIDGPGWADERIAVCEETIAKITPHWPCFQCLSEEHFFALIDRGQAQQALNYIRSQMQIMSNAGITDLSGLQENEAEALLALGHFEDALALITKLCDDQLDSCDEQVRQSLQMIRALVLARMGRVEEACEWLIYWKKLRVTGVVRWVKVIDALCHHDASYNTWSTGRELQQILDHRINAQSWRYAIDTAIIHGRLALKRNATWIARRALAQAKNCLTRLRKPCGADRLLAELEMQILKVEQDVQLPVPTNELCEWLNSRGESGEQRDPEQEAEWLKMATLQEPDNETLLLTASSALDACQATNESILLLQNWRGRHPESEAEPLFVLLKLLLNTGQHDVILSIADEYRLAKPHVALWFELQVAQNNEEWDRIEQLVQLIRDTPEGSKRVSPLLMGSYAAMKQRAYARAIPLLQQALVIINEQEQDPDNVLWDLMTAASALGEWSIVREACKKLGTQLSSEEGPIEENWGTIRLRFIEDYNDVYYLAQRTGPVTAKIFQPAWSKNQQHMDDVVVFDAALINTPPEDEEERKKFISLYDVVEVIQQGSYAPSWFIDGVDPGEEIFSRFVEDLRERGCVAWVYSSEDYQVTERDHPEAPLPGIYFMLATPLSLSPVEVDKMLNELTQHWEHPVHWLSVAKKAGLDESRHLQVIEKYSL